jgi:hypothetical protein
VARGWELLSNYQHVKAVGDGLRATAAAAWGGLRRLLGGRRVFGGQQVDLVGLVVDGHGTGTSLGLHGIDRLPLSADFLDDGQVGVAPVGAEGEAGAGIISGGIGSGADRSGAQLMMALVAPSMAVAVLPVWLKVRTRLVFGS